MLTTSLFLYYVVAGIADNVCEVCACARSCECVSTRMRACVSMRASLYKPYFYVSNCPINDRNAATRGSAPSSAEKTAAEAKPSSTILATGDCIKSTMSCRNCGAADTVIIAGISTTSDRWTIAGVTYRCI